MLGGGGVNQHMENSICFVVFIFESFPNYHIIILLLKGKYEIIAIVNTQGIDKAKVTSHNK